MNHIEHSGGRRVRKKRGPFPIDPVRYSYDVDRGPDMHKEIRRAVAIANFMARACGAETVSIWQCKAGRLHVTRGTQIPGQQIGLRLVGAYAQVTEARLCADLGAA